MSRLGTMRVRHGRLGTMVGPVRNGETYSFAPAQVELEGDALSSEFGLQDFLSESAYSGAAYPGWVKEMAESGLDAMWVQGRLRQEFLCDPAVSDLEKTSISLGFAAVNKSSSGEAHLFLCTDYYLMTGFIFSEPGPDDQTRRDIACDFWKLLLANPNDIADYDGETYHIGAGVWMRYGCHDGEFYYEESEQ